MVRNIVGIALLAAFVEMLLPEGSVARYIRLVMGLFIIISVLNPVVSWLGQRDALEVGSFFPLEEAAAGPSYLEEGARIRERAETVALEQYRLTLARQIEAFVRLVPGVAGAAVTVEVVQGWGATARDKFGSIEEVRVALWLAGGSGTGSLAGTVPGNLEREFASGRGPGAGVEPIAPVRLNAPGADSDNSQAGERRELEGPLRNQAVPEEKMPGLQVQPAQLEQEQERIIRQVRSTVASFYGLRADQVRVELQG